MNAVGLDYARHFLPGTDCVTKYNVFSRIYKLLALLSLLPMQLENASSYALRNQEIVENFVEFCQLHKILPALTPDPLLLHYFDSDAIEDFISCLQCLDVVFGVYNIVQLHNESGKDKSVTILVVSDNMRLANDFYDSLNDYYYRNHWDSYINFTCSLMFESSQRYSVLCVIFGGDIGVMKKIIKSYKKKVGSVLLLRYNEDGSRSIRINQLKDAVAEFRLDFNAVCFKLLDAENLEGRVNSVYHAVVNLALRPAKSNVVTETSPSRPKP